MQSIYYNLKNGLQDLRPHKQNVTRQSAAIRTDVKRNSKEFNDNVPNSRLPKLATLYNRRASDKNRKLLIWSTADKDRESKIRKSKNTRAPSTVTPRGKSVVQSHDRKSKSRVSHVKPIKARAGPKMKAPDLTSGTTKTCDSDHEGRLLMKENFRLHVDKMFNLLFSSTSTFFLEFHDKRNSTDICIGPWKNGKDGEQVRNVSMTVALQANVGPKTSKVNEYQTLRACSTPGQLYSIDVVSVNEGIPYADVFNVTLHYCLARSENNGTDMLIFGNVNFIKSTWAVVKAFIVKHSYEGLSEYFQCLRDELQKQK
ncbi:uncharacterized protein Dmoj_GI21111 [Drosophila mojavensis]|uniref:VASt domain-containing protein n=1 Tax=Drosophila mojavensis TaxID=7230 RepID=B4KS37_DROMO|nr:uncharacterized protein Dmoj_GI21111 [Drosophila mojavensis]